MKQDNYALLLIGLDQLTPMGGVAYYQNISSNIQNLVNEARSITGIGAAALTVSMWGDVGVICYIVQFDNRFEGSSTPPDDMIRETFEKALELLDYDEEMWVMDSDDRACLETE